MQVSSALKVVQKYMVAFVSPFIKVKIEEKNLFHCQFSRVSCLTCPCSNVISVRTKADPAPVAADVESLGHKEADHGVGAEVEYADLVITRAYTQVVLVSGEIEAGYLATEESLVGRLRRGPDVPESDLFVKVSTDDGLFGGHHVIAG